MAGRHDQDGDGWDDVGYASLYAPVGNLLSQALLTSDSSSVWVVGYTPVSDSTLIVCGGEHRAGVEHPLLAVLHLRAPGLIALDPPVTVESLIGHFGRMVVMPSAPGEIALTATLVHETARSICGLTATWPGFDPVAVAWSHEVPPTAGSWVILPGLAQSGGNLYLAGTVTDTRKAPSPGGRAMNSGLAASYSATGDLRWLSVVTVSSHTDGFFDVVVGPDAVYAVGQASEYAVHPDGFGYGLVSKLDPSTGAVRANLTFGDDHYMSQFNSAVWIAGHLVCGGLTQLESSNGIPLLPGSVPDQNNGQHLGWLVTANVSDTVAIAKRPTE